MYIFNLKSSPNLNNNAEFSKHQVYFGCLGNLKIEARACGIALPPKQLEKHLKPLEKALKNFFKKYDIPAFNKINIDPSNVDIHYHFLLRLMKRIQEGRINKSRSVLDTLKEGSLYLQDNLNGFIIKGNNGIAIVYKSLGKNKGYLSSVYPVEKDFTTWKKVSDYSNSVLNEVI